MDSLEATIDLCLNSLPPCNTVFFTFHSTGRFSVSGREGTALAPKGKVFYINREKNLKVIFDWNASGWTSRSSSTAFISITGIGPKEGLLKTDPKPWDQRLIGDADPISWMFTLRAKEGKVDETMRTAKDLKNFKLQLS